MIDSKILKFLGSPIYISPIIFDIAGGFEHAIFLSWLFEIEGKRGVSEDWLAINQREIYHTTRLTYDEQEVAIRELREKGILEEKFTDLPILYLRINHEQVIKLMKEL